MAKTTRPVKDKWLGARIDTVTDSRVVEYLEATDTIMGDLVRDAVLEYMDNHPVKQEVESLADQLKPGKEH